MKSTISVKSSTPSGPLDKKMPFRQQLEREIAAATRFRSGISSRELIGKAFDSLKDAVRSGKNGNGNDNGSRSESGKVVSKKAAD